MQLDIGYREKDKYFIYELIEYDGIIGWRLHRHRSSIEKQKFKCKSMHKGYPVISLEGLFSFYDYGSIDISEMDTSNVMTMYEMFRNSELRNINLEGLNTSHVKNMFMMFSECSKLQSVTFGDNNVSNVETIKSMFNGCKILKSVDMQHLNFEKLSNISCLFYDCWGIKEIKLPKYKIKNLLYTYSMFRNCEKLEKLDISCLCMENVTDASYMFYNCYRLSNIKMGDNFRFSEDTQLDRIANNCYALKSFQLRGIKSADVKGLLSNCNNLDILVVSSMEMAEGFKFHYNFNIVRLNKFNIDSVIAKYKLLGNRRICICTDT